jgi:hypothetical protein
VTAAPSTLGTELEGNYAIGRDPRRMTQSELRSMGHKPMPPMQAIRAHCLDCCGGSAHEVRRCMALRCPSWPFRTGKNPWRGPISEERRSGLRMRFARSDAHKTGVSSAVSVSDGLGAPR